MAFEPGEFLVVDEDDVVLHRHDRSLTGGGGCLPVDVSEGGEGDQRVELDRFFTCELLRSTVCIARAMAFLIALARLRP